MKYRASLLWVFVAAGMCIGCSGSNAGRLPVRGEVAVDGTPVRQGNVTFEPIGGQGLSTGAMIADGKYAVAAKDGLPPGEYLVRINAFADKGPAAYEGAPVHGADMDGLLPPPPKNLFPPEYNEKSSQKVKVTKEGPNAFDFKIQTMKGK
jgi:hypothetical protein